MDNVPFGRTNTANIFPSLFPSPHRRCLHFVVVVGLEWSEDPKSYAGGSLLLVGSPLPDRSKVMAQTNRGTLVLQVGGWAAG